MSEQEDDRFWKTVGDATAPRRSQGAWATQRARVMMRLTGSGGPLVRPWVALTAAGALAGGLLLLNGGVLDRLVLPEAAVAEVAWNARLTTVDGLVTVTPRGATEGVPGYAGMPVDAGDRITVGALSHAELALAAESLVELGSDSVMTVTSLEQGHTFLDLGVGALVAKMHWDKSLGRRLEVRTPTAVAAVRGTEFGLTVSPDGETSVAVFDEGRVAVRAKDAPSVQETMLEPRQETSVRPGPAPVVDARQGRSYLRVEPLGRMAAYHDRVASMRERQREYARAWREMPRAERRLERERAWSRGGVVASPGRPPAPAPQTPRARNPDPVRPRSNTPQRPRTQAPETPRTPAPRLQQAPPTPQGRQEPRREERRDERRERREERRDQRERREERRARPERRR